MMYENPICNSNEYKKIAVANVQVLVVKNRNYLLSVEQVLVKRAPIVPTDPEILKKSFMQKLKEQILLLTQIQAGLIIARFVYFFIFCIFYYSRNLF